MFEYAQTTPPAINVKNPAAHSGPTSQVSNPSAQFAAAELPPSPPALAQNTSPQRVSHFPTFAQTSANIDVPPLGQIYNNFNETSWSLPQ